MAIAARSHPEIDLEKAVSTHEFSCVPRSLFDAAGEELPTTDKSKLLHILKDFAQNKTIECSSRQAIIIDGMVLVQQLSSRKGIASCNELARHFMLLLEATSTGYDIAHVIFDCYNVSTSLKERTPERRQGHIASGIQYSCSDITPIRSSLKTFLGSSKTKGSLTEYLATKTIDHFRATEKLVVVSAQNGVECNNDSHPVNHFKTNQEEAQYQPMLREKAAVLTGQSGNREVVQLKPIHDAIGIEIVTALPSFHAFMGCDTVGRFAGKGKLSCWKALFSASDETKKHVEK
eukprot:gene8545-9456_t